VQEGVGMFDAGEVGGEGVAGGGGEGGCGGGLWGGG